MICKLKLRKILFLLFVFSLFATFFNQGCGLSAVDKLIELVDFKDSVSRRYNVKDASIVLSNYTHVKLTFTNSQYQNSSDSVKQAIAKECGRILLSLYPNEKDINSGVLIFYREEKNLLMESTSSEQFDMELVQLRNEKAAIVATDLHTDFAAFAIPGTEGKQQEALDKDGMQYANVIYLGSSGRPWATHILTEASVYFSTTGGDPRIYRLVFLDADKKEQTVYRMRSNDDLPVAWNGKELEFAGNGFTYTVTIPEEKPVRFCTSKNNCFPLEK